jgi:hypothetical protein
MYRSLIDLLLLLNVLSNIIFAVGIISFLWGLVGVIWGGVGISYASDINKKAARHHILLFISGIFSVIIMIFCITISTSNLMKPEWQIAKAISIEVDKYNENHPESVFNPTEMLSNVDNAALSIFSVIQDTPNLITKLASGKSISEIQEERDRAEFEEWRKTKNQ